MWKLLLLLLPLAGAKVSEWHHKEGTYMYRVSTQSSATTDSKQYTGFQIEMDMHVIVSDPRHYTRAKFSNAKVVNIKDSTPKGLPSDLNISPKSFYFKWSNIGRISSLQVHSSLPKYQVDFIRAVVNLFQANIEGIYREKSSTNSTHTFTVMEDSLNDFCKVEYTVSGSSNQISVTKKKDYLSCEKQPILVEGLQDEDQVQGVVYTDDHFTRYAENQMQISHGSGGHKIERSAATNTVKLVGKEEDMYKPTKTMVVTGINFAMVKEENVLTVNQVPQTGYVEAGLPARGWNGVEAPYFRQAGSYRGSHNGDLASAAVILSRRIASELLKIEKIPETKMLNKYSVLFGAVRAMTLEQIQGVTREIYRGRQATEVEQAVWKVFVDAVVNAGTVPALKAIRSWVQEEYAMLENMEYYDLVQELPNFVPSVTEEYLAVFYDMTQEVNIQEFAIAFSSLMYKARVLPVANLTNDIETKYLPYLQNKLVAALESGDKKGVQIYIQALGNTGHPKVLDIFRGVFNVENEDRRAYNSYAIAALDRVVGAEPDTMRDALLGILKNSTVNPSARVASFYHYMNLKPDLTDLRNLAAFVNNTILEGTVLRGFLDEETHYYRNRSAAAKDIVAELPPIDPHATMSFRIFQAFHDYKMAHELIALTSRRDSFGSYTFMLEDSENKLYPKLKARLQASDLINMYNGLLAGQMTEQMNLLFESGHSQYFYATEKLDSMKLKEDVLKFITASEFRIQDLAANRFEMAFPMESGFPFHYTCESPLLNLFTSNISTQREGDGVSWKADVQFTVVIGRETKMSVVNPFDGTRHTTGVDQEGAFNLPITVKYMKQGNIHSEKYNVSIEPTLGKVASQWVYFMRTTPYLTVTPVSAFVTPDEEPRVLVANAMQRYEREVVFPEPYTFTRYTGRPAVESDVDDYPVLPSDYPFNVRERFPSWDEFIIAPAKKKSNGVVFTLDINNVTRSTEVPTEVLRRFPNVLARNLTAAKSVDFSAELGADYGVRGTYQPFCDAEKLFCKFSIDFEFVVEDGLLLEVCNAVYSADNPFATVLDVNIGPTCSRSDATALRMYLNTQDNVTLVIEHGEHLHQLKPHLCRENCVLQVFNPLAGASTKIPIVMQPPCTLEEDDSPALPFLSSFIRCGA